MPVLKGNENVFPISCCIIFTITSFCLCYFLSGSNVPWAQVKGEGGWSESKSDNSCLLMLPVLPINFRPHLRSPKEAHKLNVLLRFYKYTRLCLGGLLQKDTWYISGLLTYGSIMGKPIYYFFLLFFFFPKETLSVNNNLFNSGAKYFICFECYQNQSMFVKIFFYIFY